MKREGWTYRRDEVVCPGRPSQEGPHVDDVVIVYLLSHSVMYTDIGRAFDELCTHVR